MDSNNAINNAQSLPRMPTLKQSIIGYISQIILYIIIVIYCILSPSLFSTIALIFMLISFATAIATPYYIVKTNQSDQSLRAVAYPLERILWSIFLVVNIGEFIFKIVMFATGGYSNISDNMEKFLQLQSLEYMFVPLIQIPFIAGSIIIRTQTRELSHFKNQINKLITVPIFLAMGILVLLIEIFSISIAGFLFFICILVLFVQRKIDFSSFFSWIFVLLVQILCLLFIVANFLATTDLLQFYQQFQIFGFYGIDSLNNFNSSPTARGYIICLIILFIVSCLIQRIFVYNSLWLKVTKNTNLSQIKQSDVFMQQGIVLGQQSPTKKTLSKPLIQQSGARSSLQQYQLQLIADSRTQSKVDESLRNPRQTFQTIRSLRFSQQVKQSKKKSTLQVAFETFLIGINKIVDFFYSTQFSLRFCQFLSIVVIQRYNNVYSFVAVLWLTLIASTQKIILIFYATIFLLIVQIGNYGILYAFNASQSPLETLTNLSPVYGFQKMQVFWLDIIIFNVYIFYLINFLLAVSKDRTQPLVRKSSIVPKSNYFILAVAFFFRYSYLLTLIAMFFLGFSKVNLMNFVYVVLFLIFFSTGEDVIIEVKQRNNKKITNLTTFSRKYWFVIVYFTLLCIIAKYVYFLYFPGILEQDLQPSGISQKYDWSFNFSLSNICLSNTTPFFIIFVLSEAQIMIYRSSIYLNYSFSLVSQITDLKKPRKSNFRIWLNAFAEGFMEFYYQSLYYVSGIIILACSYRWNIMGLLIIIATCYGLLRGFNRYILGFIVFVNLVNIILNYLVLFLTYDVVNKLIGGDVFDVVKEISSFLNLITTSNYNLAGAFIINIVIFYFAVQSYALKKILEENRFRQQEMIVDNDDESDQQQTHRGLQDTLSSYQPTVIQEQINNLQFARNFNKTVILAKKRLYAVVLWRKYTWWYKICNFLAIFLTDIITIFVLVCCIVFRLSVTMFYFLLLYMFYYFVLFDRVGNLLKTQQFYSRMQREFQQFKSKQKIISDQQNPRSIITGMQATQSVVAFINSTKQKAIRLRYHWRKILWFFTTFVVFGCVVFTYTAQIINSPFYTSLKPQAIATQSVIAVLYVVGISVTDQTSFFRQVYFYFFMVIFAIIERLVIKFIDQRDQEQKLLNQPHLMSRKQFKTLQDPLNFINEGCDFIQNIEIKIKQDLQTYVRKTSTMRKQSIQQQNKLKQAEKEKDFSKQSNILIYFDYKGTMLKINYLYGLLIGLLRTYLLMILVNLYEKSNIFAFFYLFSILFFWFRKLDFNLVTGINKIAILILLLQYIMLLLDINSQTSPLPLPEHPDYQTLSFLQTYLKSSKWIAYLVLDYNREDGNSYLVSFFISAVIVFLTELYFTLFFWISRICIQMVKGIYQRYEYIGKKLSSMPQKDTIYLNYQNYKSWSYRFLTLSYQLLLNNSYIIVALLILILMSAVYNFISFAIVVFACIYIYLGIFTSFSEDKNIYIYTKVFFRIVSVVLFLVLILIVIANIPVFEQNNKIILYIEQLSNLEQIFLLFLIHIWLDLSQSSQFDDATRQYNQLVQNRQDVMIKCLAYQQNREQIQRLFIRYQEVIKFQLNLRNALNIIDQWHQAMYKKKVREFENIKVSKLSPYAKLLQEQMKKQQQKRPEQEQQILDSVFRFLKNQTSVALSYNYLEIMRYIVYNNHRLIKNEETNIDIWDYILENYQILNKKVLQAETYLQKLTNVIQNQEVGDRLQQLQLIKAQQFSAPEGNLNVEGMGLINAPKKIFIDIKPTKQSKVITIIYFLLSNFSYFLSFFVLIYYLINPCLLSFPIVVYFFSYEIISDYKLSSVMLLYIFGIIVLGLLIEIQGIESAYWVKYLFYQEQDLNGFPQTNFATGYLFFIFILIFINEQIKRYQGNKFRYPHEAQSRIQGVFRMLINEDTNSKAYLWSLKVTEDYDEKEQNPMEYFGQKIENKVEQLTEAPLPSFFQNLTESKTGIDLYPFIAGIQIFLTIYLIFFYTFMTRNQYAGLDQTFKYFQFSSNMVIAVLVHVLSIVIQRRITLIQHSNKNKIIIKYWYTMLIMALLMIFLYYLAPISYSVKYIYQPTTAAVIFAFFYFIYFFLSALQIRYGYKKYKRLNSFMAKRNLFNNLIVSIFTSIPFLYELKMMMDYSFTETSLQFYDWFRLFNIYYSAFKAKLQYYYSTTGSILGSPQPMSAKFMGWAGFILIIIIIFGPMILFSGLNPIAESNLITGGGLQLGIQISGGNFFALYTTSHFSSPPAPYNVSSFDDQNFGQVPALAALTTSDIPQQFQFIQFQPFSDTNWGISYPNFVTLNQLINQTIAEYANNSTPKNNISIVVKYQFQRRITTTTSSDTNFQYPLNQSSLNQTQLQQLSQTLNQCNQSTFFPNFYISLIRLFTTGDTYKPRPIPYENKNHQNPYLNGINLTLYCVSTNQTSDTNNVFWAVNVTNSSSSQPNTSTENGIYMNVLCDKYQSLIAGLGFTALYTSVILVVAGFLRGQIDTDVPDLIYLMNPKSDSIIEISEAIGTLRDRKQFRQEYLMYFQLVDIIRSPDLMKYLSGSYPAQIQEADEKRMKKEEEDKQFSNRKDKIQ